MQNKQEQAFGYVSHSRINSIANRRLAVGSIENEWSGTSEFSGTDDIEILPGKRKAGRNSIWLG
jgi:hypothetical protein